MEIIRILHSITRWLVVAALLVALVYMLVGWLTNRPWDKRAQTIMTVFSSLIGLQWIIGLLLLVAWGSQTGFGVRHYWEHLFWQTAALIVAHGHFMLRRRVLSDRSRYLSGLLIVAGTFGLIFIGILSLPDGLRWRLYTGNSASTTPVTNVVAAPPVTPWVTEAL